MKALKDSYPFLHPVDRRKVPKYYEIIHDPMDLESIHKHIKSKHFTSGLNRMCVTITIDRLIDHQYINYTYFDTLADNKYHNRQEFLADVELIKNNSIQFNGPDSTFSKQASALFEFAKSFLGEFEDQLNQLERNIQTSQDKDFDEDELSNMDDSSFADGDDEVC